MKKIVAAGMLAFCLIAISQQQASAWTHTKFGIGLNFDRQAGGNSVGWGLWRNGQPPGPESFGGGGGGFGGQPYGAAPAPAFYPPQPQASFAPQSFAPAPQSYPPMPQGFAPAGYEPQTIDPSFAGRMNSSSPFQFANYPRPVYYYSMPYYGR